METLENQETEIDPIVVRLRKASPKVTGSLLRARAAAYADGVFPAKVKTLTALAISVVIRCEPCIEMYVESALENGATFEEVVEFLNIAMTMQGCPGEAWALKALAVFERLSAGGSLEPQGPEADTCCSD